MYNNELREEKIVKAAKGLFFESNGHLIYQIQPKYRK